MAGGLMFYHFNGVAGWGCGSADGKEVTGGCHEEEDMIVVLGFGLGNYCLVRFCTPFMISNI